MIKAILVDDEPINISNLTALLNRHCPHVEIIGSASNADDAKNKIELLKPDVVFLDIEMPGKNGFDLLRMIDQPAFEIIFVTAHDAYGIPAIKFSALDYLLKPINVVELKQAVGKAESSLQAKHQDLRLNNLLELLHHKQPDQNEKIALPTQKQTFLIEVKAIVRCESSNNYTNFTLTNGTKLLISRPLYEYDELLTPYGFIRSHQSHLVNRTHVNSMLNKDSGYLLMNFTNEKIPISKQRKNEVKAALKI